MIIIIWTNLIVGCMFECDLYWSGEVGCGTSITLETGRDDWRGQTKHKVSADRVLLIIMTLCVYAFEKERGRIIISDFIQNYLC